MSLKFNNTNELVEILADIIRLSKNTGTKTLEEDHKLYNGIGYIVSCEQFSLQILSLPGDKQAD